MRTVFLALALASCGAAATATTTTTTATTAPRSENVNGTPAPLAETRASSGRITTISYGFTPTPMMFRGRAGGPIDASTRDPSCFGSAPVAPQHTLELATPFSTLVVAAYAGGSDILLHVRLPDGRWLCNDDWDGLSPRVDVYGATTGRLEIFVASFVTSPMGTEDYVLGVSQDGGLYPSTLPFP